MLNLLELGKQTLESQVPGVGLPLPYPSLLPQLTEPFTRYSATPYPRKLAPNVLYGGVCLGYVGSSSWLYVALCSFMLSLSWPQDNLKSPYVGSRLLQDAQYAPQRPPRCPNIASK